jgi:acyl-CoA-binding protein
MADLKAQFEKAAADVQKLKQRPGNEQLLELYALYKQAAAGDVSGSRPGMLDFAGRAKYDAWAKLKGTAAEAAMKRYVDLVRRLQKGA